MEKSQGYQTLAFVFFVKGAKDELEGMDKNRQPFP
jgi:hypothetical protein